VGRRSARVAAAAGNRAGYFECVEPSLAYFGALGELVVIVGESKHDRADVARPSRGRACFSGEIAGCYLSQSLAPSIPAWAQVSSWSAVPPLTPIAPICTLSAVMIGNPPAKAMMPGTSAIPGNAPPLRSLP
jgi:hypothetical protein